MIRNSERNRVCSTHVDQLVNVEPLLDGDGDRVGDTVQEVELLDRDRICVETFVISLDLKRYHARHWAKPRTDLVQDVELLRTRKTRQHTFTVQSQAPGKGKRRLQRTQGM